jgi:RNA polymerase sigma-70 factor (ECF subfamily)
MEDSTQTFEKQTSGEAPPDGSWDVFLSYAAEDAEWVRAVEAKLTNLHLKVLDPYAIPAQFWGVNRDDVITQTFPTKCPVAFVVLSYAYSASEQCRRELEIITCTALADSPSLILPVRLDDSPVPEAIRSVATLDARSGTPQGVAEGIELRIREWRTSTAENPSHAPDSGSADASREELIRALSERVGPEVERLRRMLPHVDAEAIVQDTLIDIVTSLHRRQISNSAAFLEVLIRLKAMDLLRKERQMRKRELSWFETTRPGGDDLVLTSPLEEQEEFLRVRRAVEMLPPAERSIVTLIYIDNLTTSEVAEKLGISQGTVRSRLRRAMSVLRDLMNVER